MDRRGRIPYMSRCSRGILSLVKATDSLWTSMSPRIACRATLLNFAVSSNVPTHDMVSVATLRVLVPRCMARKGVIIASSTTVKYQLKLLSEISTGQDASKSCFMTWYVKRFQVQVAPHTHVGLIWHPAFTPGLRRKGKIERWP